MNGLADREAYGQMEATIEHRINRIESLGLDSDLTTVEVLNLLLAQVKLLD